MKARLVTKRPCRLSAGDIRRIPQAENHPAVGYLVACRCGKSTTVPVGVFADTPGQAFDVSTLTLAKPVVCVSCRARFTIDHATFVFSD